MPFVTMKDYLSKKNKFRPTRALGKASPEMRKKLSKEAPETLRAPRSNEFSSPQSYREASRKFKKYGNWASDK